MRHKNISFGLVAIGVALLLSPLFITAQTHRQKGVVRKITNSAQSPIVPVKNVKVLVGNRVSNPTSPDGRFAMDVPKEFEITGVSAQEQYLLALPTKGKKYVHSSNDVDVIVTTKEQKEAVSKEIYDRQCAKYKEKIKELQEARDLASTRARELKKAGEDYKQLEHQRDSLQKLLTDYTNEFTRFEEKIDELAEELAITDYVSLDEKERKLYELRTSGDWDGVSHFYLSIMKGDPKGQLEKAEETVQKAKEIHAQSEEMLRQALAQREETYKDMLGLMESLKMRHLNDSVSYYYKVLTDADPDNVNYLNDAGEFEDSYMANYAKAMEYFERALATNPVDSAGATIYNNISAVYAKTHENAKALEWLEKALELGVESYGENGVSVAVMYNNIGNNYEAVAEYDKALENLGKSLDIYLSTLGEDHPHVASAYNNIGAVYEARSEYDKALEYLEKALRIRRAFYGENHRETAGSYSNIGLIYKKKGDFEKALEYVNKALSIAQSIYGFSHPSISIYLNNLGNIYHEKGDYGKAAEYYEKTMNIDKEIYGEDHPALGNVYNNIGTNYQNKGDYDKAEEFCAKALDLFIRAYGGSHPSVATAYINLGTIADNKVDYQKALECYKNALEIDLSLFGENHMDVGYCYNNMGNTYFHLGDYDNALECFEKALQIFNNTLGENNLLVAQAYHNIGCLLNECGYYKEALDYYFKALEIRLEIFPDEMHPDISSSYNSIGTILKMYKLYDKALDYFEKALAIDLSIKGENHPDLVYILVNMGATLSDKKDYDEAMRYYDDALEIGLKKLGDKNPLVASIYNNIGVLYEKMGLYDKALESLEKAKDIRLSIFSENHPDVATIYNSIGSVYEDKKEYDKALEYMQKALDIRRKTFKKNDPTIVSSYINISHVYYVQKDYEAALECLLEVRGNVDDGSDLAKELDVSISNNSYRKYVKDKDLEGLKSLVIECEIRDGGVASQQGLSGNYYILEYGDWTADRNDLDFFEILQSLEGLPKDITFYRDGEIIQQHFENSVGLYSIATAIAPAEKARIMETYHKWKQAAR